MQLKDSKMSTKPFAAGSCLCGKVNYTVMAEPVRMGQCHCIDCQKSTGTGHASNAFFPKDSVKIEGETSSYMVTADNGAKLTRHFCPQCGSRLYGTNKAFPDIIGFAVGCFDDNSWFKPQVIVYSKRKPEWDIMDEGVPRFENMPPMPK